MKRMSRLFIGIISVISLLLSSSPANAIGVTTLHNGYSYPVPNTMYFISRDGMTETHWAKGEYFFDSYAFTPYNGVQIEKFDFHPSQNTYQDLTAYAYGYQVVYLEVRNCVPNQASGYGDHWRLESVTGYPLNYTEGYTELDMEERNLYQYVFRNQTADTTIESTAPIGMWCNKYLTGSDVKKPMINVITVDVYNQAPDYTGQLQEIIQKIENSSDNAGEVLQEQREEDRQDMEDAQGDASTDGADSQSQATGQGQTLLQAFISFVNAITSASPGNCNLNMNTGFIDFGIVNLCALSPPPAFQVISSIVVIGFAVPLSINASKKMIELIRSFQT